MMSKTHRLAFALILTIIAFYLGKQFLTHEHALLIGIITLLVSLWTNEALPLGVVSLMPILLFPATDIMSTRDVAGNYANPIIFLFLGGFLLAIATQVTGLHKIIAAKILQIFPNTVAGIIFSLAFTSAIMSAFLSNTTTAMLLIPIALFLSDETPLRMRLVLAIAFGASVGGIMTPIGTPPNLILLGFMEDQSLPAIGFIQWIIMTMPLAIVMLLVIGFGLSRGASHFSISQLQQKTCLSPEQKKLAWILLSMVLLLLINSPIKPYYAGLGISEKGILLGYGLLMFLPGLNFISWKDTKKIPYEIIFLFGAGFSIAAAFLETGFAQEIAQVLILFSNLETIYMVLIIAAFVTFSTELTSNTALVSMILPIIYSLCIEAQLSHELFLMVATICSSYAFMLPIATPPNAIAMASGAVRIREMAMRGLFFNLAGIVLITFFATSYWKLF